MKGNLVPDETGKFWMVWNDSPYGRVPVCKHTTQESAKNEAERLAKLEPGTRFWVLEAQGFMRITPPTNWTPAEVGMPF